MRNFVYHPRDDRTVVYSRGVASGIRDNLRRVVYTAPTARQRLATALHEAGHAVLALHEGREFDDVIIEVAGLSSGMLRGLRVDVTDDDHVRIALAGAIAHRLRVSLWTPRIFDAADDDLGTVATYLRTSAPADIRALLAWNVDETRRLLTKQWGTVERIGSALAVARCLTHSQIREMAAASRHDTKAPPGRAPHETWTRLVDHILWRVEHPGSLHDARAALLEMLPSPARR